MNVILEGVVGSTAYGMATPESDVDTLGIFVKPTSQVLGLTPGDDTVVHRDPDTTHHEVMKYCRLALKGNPTILELMWLEDHTVMNDYGEFLLHIRRAFLSEPAIRSAYAGYAHQQFTRLVRRNAEGKDGYSSDMRKRTAKHTRHLFRLLLQGRALLETGRLRIALSQHEVERLFWLGEQEIPVIIDAYEKERRKFDDAPSTIDERPNHMAVENFVLAVRRQHW